MQAQMLAVEQQLVAFKAAMDAGEAAASKLQVRQMRAAPLATQRMLYSPQSKHSQYQLEVAWDESHDDAGDTVSTSYC
jgi:hypothetical protein